MAVDTGLGATLTAMPGSFTGNVIGYDLHTSTLPMVDKSHLGTTTFREKLAGDLADAGSVTLRTHFVPTTAPPAVGDSGTLTLTDAIASGDITACNYSGTAVVTSVNHGSREIDALNTLEITVEWDGVTGPTFTAAT